MAGPNWKESIEKITNNDKIGSILSDIQGALPSFMSSQQGGSDQLVGIDIGSNQLKVIKINSTKTPYIVEYFSIEQLPTGSMTNDEIEDTTVISAAIKAMLKKQDMGARFAAMAIPRSLAIIKNITVDKRLNDDDLESKVWVEANRNFPDLVGDINLDYIIVGPSDEKPEMNDVLLVACRKKHIKQYLELTQKAGVTAKILDVNSYAFFRVLELLNKESDEKTTALLNLNLSQSSLIVSSEGRLVHAHDQAFDGKKLMQQVHVSRQAKLGESGEVDLAISDPDYYAVLQGNFISHLRHTIHFFYTSQPNTTINKIFLSGDCGTVPDLAAFIEKEISIKTEVANPFSGMDVGVKVDKESLGHNASNLVLATGLALSDIKW